MYIPNFLKFSENAFGLNISDDAIKAVQLQKKGLSNALSGIFKENLKEGAVKGGEIKDKEELKRALEKLKDNKANGGINSKNVICSIPESKTFIKVLDLPNLNSKELSEAVKWEAEANIPIPLEDVYLDWMLIPYDNSEKVQRVFAAAASKKIVDSYIDVLEGAGLRIVAIETEAVSLTRAILSGCFSAKGAILMINFNKDRTTFILYSENSIKFTSSTQESSLEVLEQEIRRAIDFAEEHIIKSDDMEIALSGYNLDLENLTLTLAKELSIKVNLVKPWESVPAVQESKKAAKYKDDLKIFEIALGLAIRGAKINL